MRRLLSICAALVLLPLAAMAQSHRPGDLAVGKLLVARAAVPDGRFQHAVVLIVAYSDQGAVGLVLNQPGTAPLSKLFPDVASAQGRTDTAYDGGPVQPERIFCLLHIAGPLREAQPVLPEIFASDSRSLMQLALNSLQSATAFRVFQGYAGWAPGQLPRELAAGRWTLVPATAALIFDPDPATLWQRLGRPPTPKPPATPER